MCVNLLNEENDVKIDVINLKQTYKSYLNMEKARSIQLNPRNLK